jgi:hypothetical protein
VVVISVVVSGAVVVVSVDVDSVVGGDCAPPIGTMAARTPAAATASTASAIGTGRFKDWECNERAGEDRS